MSRKHFLIHMAGVIKCGWCIFKTRQLAKILVWKLIRNPRFVSNVAFVCVYLGGHVPGRLSGNLNNVHITRSYFTNIMYISLCYALMLLRKQNYFRINMYWVAKKRSNFYSWKLRKNQLLKIFGNNFGVDLIMVQESINLSLYTVIIC